MRLSRLQTDFLILSLWVSLCLLYQALWLFSSNTNGQILEFGKGTGKKYKSIENVKICYNVDGELYTEMFLRNGIKDTTKTIQVRYFSFAPSYSRMNTPLGNWGAIGTTTVLVFFVVTIIFLKKDIVPKQTTFLLSRSFPFLSMEK